MPERTRKHLFPFTRIRKTMQQKKERIFGSSLKGAVFDLDGVLAHTPHYEAWNAISQVYGITHFTPDIYATHVAGKPGIGGAKAIIDYFPTAFQQYSDKDTLATTFHERKQERFLELIEEFTSEQLAFPDAIRTAKNLRKAGIRLAVASASKNTLLILDKLGISELFDVVIAHTTVTHQGQASEEKSFLGKPAPDIFLTACRELGISPQEAIGFEDASNGIIALQKAGICPIAVDRGEGVAEELRKAGAFLVTENLTLFDIQQLKHAHKIYTQKHK